jgi:hypothetical protein
MTDKENRQKVEDQERRQSGLAPEVHNDEQDDHRAQAQEVTQEARGLTPGMDSPTESERGPGDNDLMNDATQDTIEHMKDMESSGRVDMEAYRGEANHDDNVDKYGKRHKPDGLRGDGT